MAKIKIRRDVLDKARSRSNLTDDERSRVDKLLAENNAKSQYADVREYPLAFLKALLDDTRLTANQRAVVSMQIHGFSTGDPDRESIYASTVTNPAEFGSMFVNLAANTPNCEIFRNGRWYPVVMQVTFIKGEGDLSRSVTLAAQLSICEMMENVWFRVSPSLFLDETGEPRERTVLEVLNYFGLRRLETSPTEFNLKLLRAERAAGEGGQVVLVAGPVLAACEYFWWQGTESRSLGTPELPRRAIVEPELEVAENQRDYYGPYAQDGEAASRLPFVRVFSLDLKSYVYVDVDDLENYDFDTDAMQRLHLPAPMLSILNRVFDTPVEKLFGDLVDGKHGGVVILACGRPGVGKTLTAEVYAEKTERPLYVLELGELGTNAAQVEDNLRRVFTRVARWNAVLQFDECEIFLTERGDDLERSAIVGIFLRLLDYYQGILFLTTNRPDALDHAVLSRVMLRLAYPDLDREARRVIWTTMFDSACLELAEGTFDELAEAQINGRQIRNLTRLAKILYPEGRVTLGQMRGVLRYGTSPTEPAPRVDGNHTALPAAPQLRHVSAPGE